MLLMVWASGCGGGTSSDGAPSPEPDGGVACTETYDTFGSAFLTSYCVGCHGAAVAQKKVRLDSLSALTANATRAKSEVSRGAMPPRGAQAPSSEERAMFADWIACGAK